MFFALFYQSLIRAVFDKKSLFIKPLYPLFRVCTTEEGNDFSFHNHDDRDARVFQVIIF